MTTLRPSPFTGVPRGAEAKMENSVWRSSSYKSIQRTNSIPRVFIGGASYHSVIPNPSFRDDTECNINTEGKASIGRTSLVGKQIPLGRTLSFDRNRAEILHLHDEAVKSEGAVEMERRVEEMATAGHAKDVLSKQVDADARDVLPTTSPANAPEVDVHDTPDQSTRSSPHHYSPDTRSSSPAGTSEEAHDQAEAETEADPPLVGALLDLTSSLMHYLTATGIGGNAEAGTSVERLERMVMEEGDGRGWEWEREGEGILLPRLSFDVAGGWSAVGIWDCGRGDQQPDGRGADGAEGKGVMRKEG